MNISKVTKHISFLQENLWHCPCLETYITEFLLCEVLYCPRRETDITEFLLYEVVARPDDKQEIWRLGKRVLN